MFAEKILPSSATDISVHFKVRGPVGGSWDVWKVDRRRHCCWVQVDSSRECRPEIIWMRAGSSNIFDPIDAVFELTGPMGGGSPIGGVGPTKRA